MGVDYEVNLFIIHQIYYYEVKLWVKSFIPQQHGKLFLVFCSDPCSRGAGINGCVKWNFSP